jgi:hypothetical protein
MYHHCQIFAINILIPQQLVQQVLYQLFPLRFPQMQPPLKLEQQHLMSLNYQDRKVQP